MSGHDDLRFGLASAPFEVFGDHRDATRMDAVLGLLETNEGGRILGTSEGQQAQDAERPLGEDPRGNRH